MSATDSPSTPDTLPTPGTRSTWRLSGRLGRLAGWSVISQAASAASNSIVELGLALFAGVTVLGSWALYFAVGQTTIYLVRAVASEPLLADPQPHEDLASEPRTGAYLTFVMGIALALAAVAGVAAVILGSGAVALMALAIPAVLLQDALRYLAFWALRPRIAAILDLVWLAAGALGLLAINAHPTPSTAIAVWAGSAGASAAVGLALIRPRARSSATAWWRSVQSLATATTLDTVMYLSSNQWLWFWMSATAGAAALGAYRVAALVANPVLVLFLATQTLIIPGVARRGHLPRRAVGVLAAFPVAGALTTGALAVAFTAVADHTGLDTDDLPLATWVAAMLYVAAGGLAGPFAAILRGLRRGRELVVSRAASTLLTVAGAAALVPLFEATGLFTAQAIGLAAFAAGCVPALRRSPTPAAEESEPLAAEPNPGPTPTL